MITRDDLDALESAIWAVAEGRASFEQLELLKGDLRASLSVLEGLFADCQDRLESVRRVTGPERDQVVADFANELEGLDRVRSLLAGGAAPRDGDHEEQPDDAALEHGVRLQASWEAGDLVVWAAGPVGPPESNDQLADRLEAIGGPALGWEPHTDVVLDAGRKADAVSIPLSEALGWLVTVASQGDHEQLGASVHWMGHAALVGVSHVARGAVVPTLTTAPTAPKQQRTAEIAVRWRAALLTNGTIDRLVRSMPATVRALVPREVHARDVAIEVVDAVVHAVAAQAASMLEVPAPPPVIRTPADLAEGLVARLDGRAFAVPRGISAHAVTDMRSWARPMVDPTRPQLVAQLVNERADVWFLSVLARGPSKSLIDVEQALGATRHEHRAEGELERLERLVPELRRAGALRRGQVYLSTAEAWTFMVDTAPTLEAAGFDVRVPAFSRRSPRPALRMLTAPAEGKVVGAQQLSNVRWSAVFDDVELTAEEVARLATQARPLVQSRGQWVELDALDLHAAHAALTESPRPAQLTGAAILRHALGLEGATHGMTVQVEGGGWAAELLEKAAGAANAPLSAPEGFAGTLRSYQSEALGWLGFIDTVGLGGCLALDMGLGKTPTVLAHLLRCAAEGPSLVIAPAAVVGNWQSEARKFAPALRVVVHHGATRSTAAQLSAEVEGADVLITTYGTAVRDVRALSKVAWRCVVLDEAQAIKNPAADVSGQLRKLQAQTRIALTGTPIENGLGDLWSILDYCNPDLVGGRATFISQLSGDGGGEGEAALRALNGIVVFRRTKAEPEVAAELPDKIDELDHCTMTREQIGLYQAVLDSLIAETTEAPAKGAVLAAITALKQICNHPAAYQDDGLPLTGRSGKLARLEEILDAVFAADERLLIFTHFAQWGIRMAAHLSEVTGVPIDCYHGQLTRGVRDRMVRDFQNGTGAGALVLSLTAGGTGLNLTAANHVVLYDRWWNPAKEDQARDRAWRIGQTRTVVSHRLVCPGTIDERVEEVVSGKRQVADIVLPKSSSLDNLSAEQLRAAFGLDPDLLLTEDTT